MDEPSSDLDVIARKKLREFINYCHSVLDINFVIASHNIHDVFDCCRNTLILNKGEKLYYGSTEQVMNKNRCERIILYTATEEEAKEIAGTYHGEANEAVAEIVISENDHPAVLAKLFAEYSIKQMKVLQNSPEEIVSSQLEKE